MDRLWLCAVKRVGGLCCVGLPHCSPTDVVQAHVIERRPLCVDRTVRLPCVISLAVSQPTRHTYMDSKHSTLQHT